MTRAEILAHNAGIGALAKIAASAAAVLRMRITEAPTRYGFAIEALEGIVEAAGELMLLPPDGTEPSTASAPRPLTPAAEGPAQCSDELRCKEVADGC